MISISACSSREDGVTLREIMQQTSSPDYAFLVARQTSIGGEKVSDEAIDLAAAMLDAGYLGVWGISSINMDPRFDETTPWGTSGEVVDESGRDGAPEPLLHAHRIVETDPLKYDPQVEGWWGGAGA